MKKIDSLLALLLVVAPAVASAQTTLQSLREGAGKAVQAVGETTGSAVEAAGAVAGKATDAVKGTVDSTKQSLGDEATRPRRVWATRPRPRQPAPSWMTWPRRP